MAPPILDDDIPSGTPVGRALAVPNGPFHVDLITAAKLIDRVHGDGELPIIAGTVAFGLRRRGVFVFDESEGRPIAVRVDAALPDRVFNGLHEIGHFLDFSGIGRRGTWASRIDPRLSEWRRAVGRSRAFRQLSALARRETAIVAGPTGSPYEAIVPREVVAQSIPLEECWARSYAQFIATTTGDGELINSLDRLRQRVPGCLYIPLQWEDGDFAAIASAVAVLFRRLGWRSTTTS
jgi:hypothetical protein